MRGTAGRPPDLTGEEFLSCLPDPLFMVDGGFRITHVNEPAADLLRSTPEDLVGRGLWDAFPAAVGTTFEREYRRAIAEQRTVRFTEHFEPLGTWFSVRAVPVRCGLAVFFTDVGDLKTSEARVAAYADAQALLRRVATAVAADADAETIHRVVCREAARLVDAHSAWLLRFAGDGYHVLGSHAPEHLEVPAPDAAVDLLPGSTLEEVRDTGLPVVVDGRPGGRMGDIGLSSAVLVPIRLGGAVWGTLVVAWSGRRGDLQEVQGWLLDLAELVSLALGNAEARSELARRSTTDALTGLANRRALDDALERALSRGRRHDHPLTLALVDVDDVKAVNDGAGHVVGDRVLAAVAEELQAAVRTEDIVARLGGDDFAVLFDGGDAAAAHSALDRVRARLESALVRRGLPAVTVSAGLCEWEPGMSIDGLRGRAEDALAWAKRNGRDGAWVHDPELMELPGPAHRRAGAGEVVSAAEVQRRLRSTRAFWQSTVDALPQRIAVLSEDGEILAVNDAWRGFEERLGRVGSNLLDVRMPEDMRARLLSVLEGREQSSETEVAIGDRWWRMRADRFADERRRRVVVHHEDVTERRRAEKDARLRATLLDAVDVGVVATRLDGTVTAWNRGAERLFGYAADEVLGRSMPDLVHEEDLEHVARLEERLFAEGHAEAELVVHDRAGRALPVIARHTLLRNRAEVPVARLAVVLDVSERHQYQQDLEAARDYLGAVTSSMADGLLVIAGDGRIAYANQAAADLLGRPVGSLPGAPAEELLHGRPGGLLGGGSGPASAEDDEFLRADGTTMPVAWTRSPLGMGAAGEHVVVFHDATERRSRELRLRREAEGLRWAARIRRALDDDLLQLVAQPIVDVASGAIVHHELLLRMRDGMGGLIAPGQFLPAAEEHDLMADVDTWVLRRAVEVAATGLSVHVNLSARSVGDAAVLDALGEALEDSGIDPSMIVVEVTETALMRPGADAGGFLRRVRDIGCGIALDDFGTGYSGLERVTQTPVDALKIDISFVRGLLDDPVKESVVRAMVTLAADLGAVTVAEGVEDRATLERLKALGVQQAQGYLLGRPAPLD